MSRFLARLSVIVIIVTATTTLFVMDRFFLVTRAAKAGAVACGGGQGRHAAATARRPMASFTIARGPRSGRNPLPPVALVTRRPLFLCSHGGGAGDAQPFKINAFNTPGMRPGYVCVKLLWDGEGFICNPRRLKCLSFFLPCTKRNNENKNVRLPQQHFVRQFASSSTSSSSSSTPPTPPPPFSGGGGDDPYGKKAKETGKKAKPAKEHKKKAGELYEEAKDKAEHMWEDTKEAASEAKEMIMDAASTAKEKVQEKLSTATEKAKKVKGTVKENVQGAKAKVKGTKEVRVLEFLCRVTGGARSLFMHINLIYFSARYYFPPSLPTFLLIPQSAKHKMKETYEMVTEKLGATPQSAREYKKGIEETASETMDGKRRRRVTRKKWELCRFMTQTVLRCLINGECYWFVF